MKNARKSYSRVVVHAAVIVLSLTATSHAAEPQSYLVDPKDSSVSFSVKHMVISEVRGRFKKFSGTIMFDEADLSKSSVAFTVETPTVDTDNEKRDNDLRGPMFLDVAKYQEMSFSSQRVEKKDREYLLIGSLRL